MQVPFLKYIEAMLIAKIPIPEIVQSVKSLNTVFADKFDEAVIASMGSKLYSIKPEYFQTSGKLPELDWLKEMDVEKMVAYFLKLELPSGVTGIKGAFEIMRDPEMYKAISAMALSKITEEDIELIVNGKFNIHYESEDIKEFMHYFFNVRDWSLTRKKEYVNLVLNPKLSNMYKLALEGDKDYLLWKLGIAPDRSFDQMLRELMSDSFYNAKEKLKADPDSARKWIDLALKITDRMEKLDKDTKDKKNLFDELIFTVNGTSISTATRNTDKGDVSNKVEITLKNSGVRHFNDLE